VLHRLGQPVAHGPLTVRSDRHDGARRTLLAALGRGRRDQAELIEFGQFSIDERTRQAPHLTERTSRSQQRRDREAMNRRFGDDPEYGPASWRQVDGR
jgi:hypothetical protein